MYVRSEYDTGQLGGTVGASGEGFGLDGTYKGTNADLTKVESQDFAVPGSTLQPMANCKS